MDIYGINRMVTKLSKSNLINCSNDRYVTVKSGIAYRASKVDLQLFCTDKTQLVICRMNFLAVNFRRSVKYTRFYGGT